MKISADYIFPVSREPVKNGILEIDTSGQIIGISHAPSRSNESITYYKGILCPGFINAHCHIELSCLKGKIPKGKGLTHFITHMMHHKQKETRCNNDSILLADAEMYANGIAAVCDISNTENSFEVKKESKINYHTFIEISGVHPGKAKEILISGKKLRDNAIHKGLNASITLHSSYSSSPVLRKLFKQSQLLKNAIITIHNQESDEENSLFQSRSGTLYSLLTQLGLDSQDFNPSSQNPLQVILPFIKNASKILLVHNTYTKEEDVKYAIHAFPNIFWVLCPNSNLYIENKLPDIPMFFKSNLTIAVGTDSYASNTILSVLEELKTIHRHYPDIPLYEMIRWSTLNGAKALGLQSQLGTLEPGKAPGINLISNVDLNSMRLCKDSHVDVIIPYNK